MNYENKYNDALEKLQEALAPKDGREISGLTRACIEEIFPELKESEDERIRKSIIENLKGNMYRADGDYDLLNKQIAWLEKQRASYSKKDIDDAYLKGMSDAKNEIEKQHEANYQIRKDIATFIFNYKGDIKDRAKWMNYLGVKISFVEKQDNQKPQGKTALEAIQEEKIDNANKIEQSSAWSEEDEKNLKRVIWYVENPALNVVKDTMLSEWLKSIKERVQPQPKQL